MPSQADMELAKQIMNKGLVSKIEVQRHLDDLDEILRSGKQMTLEALLLERKILSEKEFEHLKAPKKRIMLCAKCNTKYSVREEDVDTRFKCRNCGTVVIVPPPGQAHAMAVEQPDEPPGEECGAAVKRTKEDEEEAKDAPIPAISQGAPKSEGQEESEPPQPEGKVDLDAICLPENPEDVFARFPVELILLVDREAPVEDDPEWWQREEDGHRVPSE